MVFGLGSKRRAGAVHPGAHPNSSFSSTAQDDDVRATLQSLTPAQRSRLHDDVVSSSVATGGAACGLFGAVAGVFVDAYKNKKLVKELEAQIRRDRAVIEADLQRTRWGDATMEMLMPRNLTTI